MNVPTHERRNLSSPNKMVWELFAALRRLCARVEQCDIGVTESEVRQDAALTVLLAVQCVEVFFNVFFRVVAGEEKFAHATERIIADLKNKSFILARKIR